MILCLNVRASYSAQTRKNGINTVKGDQASVTAYSTTATDKANNLKTYQYDKYLLTELPKKVFKKMDSTFFGVILCRGHLKRRRLVVR